MGANAAERLLQHYVDNFRRLPWRSPPGEAPPDPYRVWLSEVMLQQTTVAAVTPRFDRFLESWPTIEALAAARDEDVLSEWAGLGYYARARNLIACARAVAQRGGFPSSESELRQLPGIGAYTAASVAAIAFGRPVVPVDTNIERVIARLFGIADPSRTEIGRLAGSMILPGRAGDLAQALMDLGATICRPKRPACGECPLRPDCLASAGAEPEAYPRPKARRKRPLRSGTAWWIEREGCVWLVRRPSRGLLGGMAALPGTDWVDDRAGLAHRPLGTINHVFTHFTLELSVAEAAEPAGDGWWQPLDRLEGAGLPTLYRKAASVALDARGRGQRAAA
ncbi:MAG TPA: A/G-specific adenine glycosylase [Sphingomicrobium sp.]|nr:A/G-specific adenine glycosylase [Sphingomicrobium sp.]